MINVTVSARHGVLSVPWSKAEAKFLIPFFSEYERKQAAHLLKQGKPWSGNYDKLILTMRKVPS
jgi:hypothetical protein